MSIANYLFMLMLLGGTFPTCLGQMDSVRKKDLNHLYTIIVKNLKIPDSVLEKPKDEGIFFEIAVRDNEVADIQIWRKESRFLYTEGVKISKLIKEQWKPSFKFPPTIIYPLYIHFLTDPPNNSKQLGDEIFSKIPDHSTDNYLIVKPFTFVIVSKAVHEKKKAELRNGMK